MNRNIRRTVATLIAAPAVAAALFGVAAPASAKAAPDDTAACSMAMPAGRGATSGAPSAMTRAGQLALAAPASRSTAVMAGGCNAATR